MTQGYPQYHKVMVIGCVGVGKSCLVKRFIDGVFPRSQTATVGVDYHTKVVTIDSEPIELQIWDTAGQERFHAITASYYRSASAVILVFDVTCLATFERLPWWIKEINAHTTNTNVRILVGNKTDYVVNREVPWSVANEFATQYGMAYMEASALESINVELIFFLVARQLRDQQKQLAYPNVLQPVTLKDNVTASCANTIPRACSCG